MDESNTETALDLGAPAVVPRNRQILCRFLEGQHPEVIAQALGLELRTVQLVLRKPGVKAEIDRLAKLTNEQVVRERVAVLGEEALDTIRDVMRGVVSGELRFKAAKDLLDRNPLFRDRSLGEEVSQGLGEAIIFRLAQLAAKKREEEETPVNVEQVEEGSE